MRVQYLAGPDGFHLRQGQLQLPQLARGRLRKGQLPEGQQLEKRQPEKRQLEKRQLEKRQVGKREGQLQLQVGSASEALPQVLPPPRAVLRAPTPRPSDAFWQPRERTDIIKPKPRRWPRSRGSPEAAVGGRDSAANPRLARAQPGGAGEGSPRGVQRLIKK